MAVDVMLTTVDNPYNPFTQYEDWLSYDTLSGHNSNALLARVAVVNDELSEEDIDEATVEAIEEIVRVNASGLHTKAYA